MVPEYNYIRTVLTSVLNAYKNKTLFSWKKNENASRLFSYRISSRPKCGRIIHDIFKQITSSTLLKWVVFIC